MCAENRVCGTNCEYFMPLDEDFIKFLNELDQKYPTKEGTGICELDFTSSKRLPGDKCIIPNTEARIDPEG
jgi:hypothetical protein